VLNSIGQRHRRGDRVRTGEQARHIVTTDTLGDRFAEYLDELEAGGLTVEAVPVPSLVPYDARRAPKRFSGWWREWKRTHFAARLRTPG
jgi:antitoxin (DNA-binding transcriptional repressor) of toxin-antitoxin stability system